MSYLVFLKAKSKGYSFGTMLRLECESLFIGLASIIPTTFGVIIRAGLCKLFLKSCSGFAWIQPRVTIIHSERITVGSHFAVNSGTYLNGLGGIEMGSHVLIGNNVTISSGQHPIDGRCTPVFARQSLPKKIVIENDVWVGAGAVIMPGVRLAQGTVVGANAVVTRDTAPYSVVVGAPARAIRSR